MHNCRSFRIIDYMKTKPFLILFLFIILILFGCSKDNNSPVLDGVITDCPVNRTCTYDYYENADFNLFKPVSGNFTVFWYSSTNSLLCNSITSIYVKVPASIAYSSSFVINSSQIAAGQQVGYDFSCDCCYYVGGVKPIGGLIKGKKDGPVRWLINAKIILSSPNKSVDTLIVNQYFTLKPR